MRAINDWRRRALERWREGIRHRVTPLGAMMLALLFASGILAFTTAQNVFFLLFSLLVTAILISSFVNRLMLAGLEVKLEVPEHAMAGEGVNCRLVIENRKHFLASFALELVAPINRRFCIPIVTRRGNANVEVDVIWARRGVPDPVTVDLSTRFPFGFSVRRTRVLVHVNRALYPSIREQDGFAECLALALAGANGLRAAADSEFSHLREYAQGDDWRRIAWGKSAASAFWVVREHQSGGRGRLRLWFDSGSPDFERLVSLAAYLVWQLQFAQTPFVFCIGVDEIPVTATHEAYTILSMLASLEPLALELPLNEQNLFILSYRSGYLPGPIHPSAAAASAHQPNRI